jgi:hypothetical protein
MNRDELIIASFCLIDDVSPIFCETTSRPCGWGLAIIIRKDEGSVSFFKPNAYQYRSLKDKM